MLPGGNGVFVTTGSSHRARDSQSHLAVSQPKHHDIRDMYPLSCRDFNQTVSELDFVKSPAEGGVAGTSERTTSAIASKLGVLTGQVAA